MKLLTTLLVACGASLVAASPWYEHYTIESIALPKEVSPQIGGITTMADGRLAMCFHSGEVYFYDPESGEWFPFAVGLQEPLGIVAEDDGSVVVMHWPELTRISDTDGDGKADSYENLFDDFGISGNYHEFAFGPARDEEGNYYVSLNVASNFRGIFDRVRGPVSPIGLDEEIMKTWRNEEEWKKIKGQAGRMFSRVPYRGCVMKIRPDGRSEVFAYGFRSPDGIGIDGEGRLWVTDNQGDWRGTSPLYHVKKGEFYGHPASLVWKPGWDRNPLEVPVEELDAMRTPASGLFPHGELANSPTQPIPVHPKFGLPEGELLIGEMNQPTFIRFLADEVDGFVQGTAIPFLMSPGLDIGNHRMTFTEDGSLWAGKTHVAWAGGEGLMRIRPTGKPAFLVDEVRLTSGGFRIGFNEPLAELPQGVKLVRHRYHYHAKYGSEKVDVTEVEMGEPVLEGDGGSLFLPVGDIREGYLHTIDLGKVTSAGGKELIAPVLRYNVVRKPGED